MLATGASNTAIGYHAGVAMTTGNDNPRVGPPDHFTVIVQCHLSPWHTDRVYAMLLNKKEKVEVWLQKGKGFWTHYHVNGYEYRYNTDCIDNAIDRHKTMHPKWIHLYQYFVTTNTIGCTDIFQHLFTYYFLTLY